MDEIVKICKVHGELKRSEFFLKNLHTRNLRIEIVCKTCKKLNARKYYRNHKEKILLKSKKYAKLNFDKMLMLQEKYRKELSDTYVIHKIIAGSNVSSKDIPPELIELKRVQLQIHRHLKELKNGNKQHGSAT